MIVFEWEKPKSNGYLMATHPISTRPLSRLRKLICGIGLVAAYFVFGSITSILSALVGILVVPILRFGFSGAAVLIIPIVPYFAYPIALALSVPVTFCALPIVALIFRHRPATQLLALALTGAISGCAVLWLWVSTWTTKTQIQWGADEFIIAGAFAGAVAGMLYSGLSRSLRE
jgi:hypothetical protein